MKFKELSLFARDDGGSGIAPAAARALGLPMPDDVLEQFILDHGLNHHFRAKYGELDLHGLAWSKERLPIGVIASCSSKFNTFIAENRSKYGEASLDELPLRPSARTSWSTTGTWDRAPVFLFDVLPPPDARHLVEGHTRVGALLGFQDNPHKVAAISPNHDCWIGRRAASSVNPPDWKGVRRRFPISFKRWLFEAIGEDTLKGDVADVLIDAEARHRYELSTGNDLESLLELMDFDPSVPLERSTLVHLYDQWRAELELLD